MKCTCCVDLRTLVSSQGRKTTIMRTETEERAGLRVSGPRLEDTELLMVRRERIIHGGGGAGEEKAKSTGMAGSHRRGTM